MMRRTATSGSTLPTSQGTHCGWWFLLGLYHPVYHPPKRQLFFVDDIVICPETDSTLDPRDKLAIAGAESETAEGCEQQ